MEHPRRMKRENLADYRDILLWEVAAQRYVGDIYYQTLKSFVFSMAN